MGPFIVYSSNLLAILSLRSLYSLVSQGMSELEYLEKAVGIVLGFIGVKMGACDVGGFEISTASSLSVVCALLAGGVGLSVLTPGGFGRRSGLGRSTGEKNLNQE